MKKENITIDMEKHFLKGQIECDETLKTMSLPEGTKLTASDLYRAILKHLEELEEKKNENGMSVEAYERRLDEANDTISRLQKDNKVYENVIERLQEAIVSQALQIVDLKKAIAQAEKGEKE